MSTEVTNQDDLTPEQIEEQEEAAFLSASRGEEPPPVSEEARREGDAEVDDQGENREVAAEAEEGDGESSEVSVDDELANLSPSTIAKLEERLMSQMEQRLSGRLRNIEGHIGGLKHNLTQLSAASKAAREQGSEAPSKAQINEAMQSGEKLKALKDDFPEWAEALQEGLDAVASRIPQIDEQALNQRFQSTEQAAQEQMRTARQLARLDNAYPDWEQTVQTDAFQNWLANQPEDIQQKTSSENAADAIAVLDAFQEHTKASAPDLTAQSRQKTRLESAITPTTGGQVTRRQPKTEHEEFLEAFNSRG
ncbi:hypothetical protein ACFQH5_20230 [Halomonas salifodinae]|uniref:Uncharacterized protein n=1 Tax=Halomonas salifodinae TaxID=438745 RepID=A0ABW2F3Y4_9GAMM